MEGIGAYFGYLLKWLVGLIDGLIYTLDAELYNLMIKIAQAKIFSENTLGEVAERVYQLLALMMMFRLIFVFLSYVINPEEMIDKTKGYQNIIKKMIISLGLIIVVPWGFMQARNIQTIILDDGVIEYFVFGQNHNTRASSGYELMHTVGQLFITPYTCDEKCDGSKVTVLCPAKDWSENIPQIDDMGMLECKDSSTCGGSCGSGAGDNKDYAIALKKASISSGTTYDLGALMGLGQYRDEATNNYYVEYRYPFIGTTLVGIVIGYMLIIMCIDVAVRSIKLSFYEIIAPIPIVSNIGPKSGKDSMLGKWANQTLKTYGDLFTRILGLQLAAFFINTLLDNSFKENDFIVNLFLIIGALTFAKKLPDILKDLGVNFDTGGFSLKKKLQPAGALAGMAAGTIGGIAGNFAAARQTNKGFFRAAGSAIAGALPGAMRGMRAGLNDKNGIGISSGFSAAGEGGQRIIKRAGTSFRGRMIAGAQQRLGLDTEADRLKKRFDNQDEWQKVRKAMEEHAMDEINKKPGGYTVSNGAYAGENLATLRQRISDAESSGFDETSDFTATGVTFRNVTTGATETRDINLSEISASIEVAKRTGADRDTIATLQNAYNAALRQGREQYAQQIVAMKDRLAGAEKAAKAEWIDANGNDSQISAGFAQLNSLEDKLGYAKTTRFTQAGTTAAKGEIGYNKSAIENDYGTRYSASTRRAERTKEASKPKGGK